MQPARVVRRLPDPPQPRLQPRWLIFHRPPCDDPQPLHHRRPAQRPNRRLAVICKHRDQQRRSDFRGPDAQRRPRAHHTRSGAPWFAPRQIWKLDQPRRESQPATGPDGPRLRPIHGQTDVCPPPGRCGGTGCFPNDGQPLCGVNPRLRPERHPACMPGLWRRGRPSRGHRRICRYASHAPCEEPTKNHVKRKSDYAPVY